MNRRLRIFKILRRVTGGTVHLVDHLGQNPGNRAEKDQRVHWSFEGKPEIGDALNFYWALILDHILKGGSEDQVRGISANGALVLSPQEGPVVVVLKVVGLSEQYAGCHIAGDKREVGPVVSVKYLFGTGGSHGGYQ